MTPEVVAVTVPIVLFFCFNLAFSGLLSFRSALIFSAVARRERIREHFALAREALFEMVRERPEFAQSFFFAQINKYCTASMRHPDNYQNNGIRILPKLVSKEFRASWNELRPHLQANPDTCKVLCHIEQATGMLIKESLLHNWFGVLIACVIALPIALWRSPGHTLQRLAQVIKARSFLDLVRDNTLRTLIQFQEWASAERKLCQQMC